MVSHAISMKFSKKLFGYNRAEVDETVARMENTIKTLETNVEYLKIRCEALEKQSKKAEPKAEEKDWQIDKSVVLPIKKTLQQETEQERID